jgi:hypothetical protein
MNIPLINIEMVIMAAHFIKISNSKQRALATCDNLIAQASGNRMGQIQFDLNTGSQNQLLRC